MDPFTGLGSSAVACARLGINFIGSEIDEIYLAEAVTRTRTAVLDEAMAGKRAMKKSGVSGPKSQVESSKSRLAGSAT